MADRRTHLIGAHLSIAGGWERLIERAVEARCNTFQMFSRSPRMWRSPPLEDAQATRFRELRAEHVPGPVVIHGNYLINMASADRAIRERSIEGFRDEVARARQLGADYLIIHPGSYRGQTLKKAMWRLSRAIARATKGVRWEGLALLLENTAGGGMSIGREFAELAELKGRIADHSRAPVGFCIDTAHCYEAGYDVSTAGGLEETLALIDAELGLANVKVIHANDSKTALGSRVDRHARIGEGHLGKAAFRRMLRHPGLARKPFILEVPAVEGSQVTNVKAFWALARQPRADRPKQTARRTTQS